MNLYWAFANVSWGKLLAANIVPFTTVYRPMGALYYRSVFEVAGLNPLGFRLVTYAFLYLNILLLILVVRRLTGSSEIALISALVWCYHGRSVDIWVNNGTVYDVLCFTCVMTALLFWISVRQKQISPRWYHHLTVVLLPVCAINAKEMGVTLPLLLLTYEVIYYLSGKKQGLARWLVRDLGAIWLMLFLMPVAILTKTAEGSPMYRHFAYAPHFTIEQFFRNHGRFLDDLFYRMDISFQPVHVVALWALLILTALLLRSKALLFAVCIIVITPLPVVFIPTRGFFVMYLPYAGWALFAAVLVTRLRDWLWERVLKRGAIAPALAHPAKAATILLVLFALVHIHRMDPTPPLDIAHEPSRERIASAISELQRLRPCPAGDKGIAFVDPRWEVGEHGLTMIVRLVCRNPTLKGDLVNESGVATDRTRYAYTIIYDVAKNSYIVHGGDGLH